MHDHQRVGLVRGQVLAEALAQAVAGVRADDHDVLGLRMGIDWLGAEFAGDVDLVDVAVQVPVDGVGATQGQQHHDRDARRRPGQDLLLAAGMVVGRHRDGRPAPAEPAEPAERESPPHRPEQNSRRPRRPATSSALAGPCSAGPHPPAHARGLDQARPCQRAPCVLTPYPDPVGARAVSARDARPSRSVTPGCTNHPTRRNVIAMRIVSPPTKYPPGVNSRLKHG